jgi:hypothetical protein
LETGLAARVDTHVRYAILLLVFLVFAALLGKMHVAGSFVRLAEPRHTLQLIAILRQLAAACVLTRRCQQLSE